MSKAFVYRYLVVSFLLLLGWETYAQTETQAHSGIVITEEIKEYKQQVTFMISFLESSLNLLGSSQSSAREKETIINDSYEKIFKDAKVQVEDDLAEGRTTPFNKDVQAYLKDVDFFFQDVSFKLNVEEINHRVTKDNELFFIAILTREMKGMLINGDSIRNNKIRYIEVNVNQETDVLKIASIYTNKISEKEDLQHWWNGLPRTWKYHWANDVYVQKGLNMMQVLAENDSIMIEDTIQWKGDTLTLNHPQLYASLKKLKNLKSLDLSNNKAIADLSPISRLTSLEELRISGTLVRDLTPLRSLTYLKRLYCGKSLVTSLAPLRYAIKLEILSCPNTPVSDLSVIKQFPNLRILNCKNTLVNTIKPLASATVLQEFICSGSPLPSLSGIQGAKNLQVLLCDSSSLTSLKGVESLKHLRTLSFNRTGVQDLSPLASLNALEKISCEGSRVSTLTPLLKLDKLSQIYCDGTPIDEQKATAFMAQKPSCLVVYASNRMQNWWAGLSNTWKSVLNKHAKLPKEPSVEQLHRLTLIDSLDISGQSSISDLVPISMLPNLRYLNCKKTGITSLEPLKKVSKLEFLDCSENKIELIYPLQKSLKLTHLNISNTQVSRLEPLEKLSMLRVLYANSTAITSLRPLIGLGQLEKIYCDESPLQHSEVNIFLHNNPTVLVVHQSEALTKWWDQLSGEWQGIFKQHVDIPSSLSKEALHSLIYSDSIGFENTTNIGDLTPLKLFPKLKVLYFSNTQIASLAPISRISSLEVLSCARSPIADISILSKLGNLKKFTCENTAVESLEPLVKNKQLQVLKFGGTPIKDLKALETLAELVEIDCSNTSIKSLKSLLVLPKLKRITCYRTKLTEKKVQAFKDATGCEVVFY